MNAFFGGGPDPAKAPEPAVEILGKADEGDHERWRLRYLVDANEHAYAYLLLPKPLREGERRPLVLCPHPTADIGKDRVVGIYKDRPATAAEKAIRAARHYALDLVRRGMIVFAPDRAAFGERRLRSKGGSVEQMAAYSEYISKRYPGWKLSSGKNIWDLQRALDFLVKYKFVDADRIGVIGHSLGAWDSIMLIAMDDRVTAAVVNSGKFSFRPELWRDPAAMRAYLANPAAQDIRSNANVFLQLAAPRPVLYLWSLQDKYERGDPHLMEGWRVVTEYYQQVSGEKEGPAKADISAYFHPHGHDFPPEARELAYRWLEIRLGVVDAAGNTVSLERRATSN